MRRDRRLRNAHPERLQRVFDRGNHRGGGGNGTDLAGTLGAERIERRWRLSKERLDHRDFRGARQQIIGKARGEGLPDRIVSHPFQDCVADTVRHAATHLSFDQHGID